MAEKFTSEQRQAIDARDCDLLVSAAAGSGKTEVLITRLIERITDTQKPVELDRLLVVTFTDAAAQEMRKRLGDALRERLREAPDDPHLQRQMLLMPKASITTIHAFCLQVVRSNFARLGIDPGFRVADTTEVELLKAEVMRALFERLYGEDEDGGEPVDESVFGAGGRADFYRLVEFYGDAVKDDALQALALELYEFSRSKPWPEQWLTAQADSFRVESAEALEQTDWYTFMREEAASELDELTGLLTEAIALAQSPHVNPANIDTLNDECSLFRLARRGLDEGLDAFIRAAGDINFRRWSGAKSKKADASLTEDEVKAYNKRVKDLRDEAKERFLELKKRVAVKHADELLDDMNDLHGVMHALAGVVNLFAALFGQEKRRRNIADFSDFEQLCLEALLEDGSTEDAPIPTAAALALQARFEEVYVDEYQDSSWVQELILLSVSRRGQGAPNRFMVGDMKQSIYRFRMANPELFRRKYAAYSREAGGKERLIGLSTNFRSRDGVLNCINFLFRQTMDEQLGDVAYDADSMLYFGADYYPAYDCEDDRAAEVLLVETKTEDAAADDTEDEDGEGILPELTAIEAEARAVAARIHDMVNGEKPVQISTKDGGFRPAAYSDIVILMRSVKGPGEIYAEELRRAGVPSFAGASGGYFEAAEVLTMLAFLQVIDNPRQDLHLITVLHSPVYGFTADELVVIRQCAEGLFYDALLAAAEQAPEALRARLNAFLTRLTAWRERAVLTPISKLLWSLYEETGYLRRVGAMAGGQVRRANLIALFERAVQYERTSLKGLFHFIRYIERLQKSGQELGDAKVLGENENVVRIMSVHKSKGLQFPVVFVCGLGRQFNQMDIRAPFVMHADYGFGPKHINLKTRVVSDTLKRNAIAMKLRRENLSEELRLLYVALTRARERLVLCMTMDNVEKALEKHARAIQAETLLLPSSSRLRAGRFSDWLLPALARHRDMAAHIGAENGACAAAWEDTSRWRFAFSRKTDAAREEQAEAVSFAARLEALHDAHADDAVYAEASRLLRYRYDSFGADAVPSKLSVSEIKRLYYAENLAESASLLPDAPFAEGLPTQTLRPPRFAQGEAALTAAGRGTLTHTVLEHIDFAADTTAEALAARVDGLAARGFLRAEEAGLVDTGAILAFLQSPLAERIRQSPDVRREVRFVSGEKPSDITPAWDARITAPIVVHGVIDLMFREGDGFVLVDYKTDRFPADRLDEVAARYAPQIKLYRSAIQKFTGLPVTEAALYFFDRKIVKLLS